MVLVLLGSLYLRQVITLYLVFFLYTCVFHLTCLLQTNILSKNNLVGYCEVDLLNVLCMVSHFMSYISAMQEIRFHLFIFYEVKVYLRLTKGETT